MATSTSSDSTTAVAEYGATRAFRIEVPQAEIDEPCRSMQASEPRSGQCDERSSHA
jgi:hypothetical protein